MKEVAVKMAKATPDDLRSVREFFQMLEEIADYGTFTPENEDFEEDSISIETDEKLGELVRERWPNVAASWMRVVFGCDILISNCCDSSLDFLAWKPEIQEFLESQLAGD